MNIVNSAELSRIRGQTPNAAQLANANASSTPSSLASPPMNIVNSAGLSRIRGLTPNAA